MFDIFFLAELKQAGVEVARLTASHDNQHDEFISAAQQREHEFGVERSKLKAGLEQQCLDLRAELSSSQQLAMGANANLERKTAAETSLQQKIEHLEVERAALKLDFEHQLLVLRSDVGSTQQLVTEANATRDRKTKESMNFQQQIEHLKHQIQHEIQKSEDILAQKEDTEQELTASKQALERLGEQCDREVADKVFSGCFVNQTNLDMRAGTCRGTDEKRPREVGRRSRTSQPPSSGRCCSAD